MTMRAVTSTLAIAEAAPEPASTGAAQLTVSYAGTGDALTDEIVKSLRYKINGLTGGDVRGALGQGPVRT